ncbi:MAG: hypothetical protein QOH63_3019 [Acidobacteriota bacterium]|nr:hypothetical protein [Acidobacteriota bacterium]
MSTNEIYADDARSKEKPSRRFAVVLLAILFAVCMLGAAAYFIGKHRVAPSNNGGAQGPATVSSSNEAQPAETAPAKTWKITGSISEACTCAVPCSCNFGQGPSPHSYCYPFYSYHIRKGNYGDTVLDDLHFGSADLRSGRYMFIDERANESQREALRLIMARVIERVPASEAEKKAKEIAESVRYEAVEQTYDDRKNHLKVAGLGEFAADYVMGLDKQAPVVVRNNTTWRVRETIKAKTSFYRVKLGRDVVDTKDTNSNQGEFEYTDAMDFGGPARWNCGADANHAASGAGEQTCGR